tara:strand:+ start:817 stop:1059 length:243 start_codon:yes stop_codon:yes gene_type:complete
MKKKSTRKTVSKKTTTKSQYTRAKNGLPGQLNGMYQVQFRTSDRKTIKALYAFAKDEGRLPGNLLAKMVVDRLKEEGYLQ